MTDRTLVVSHRSWVAAVSTRISEYAFEPTGWLHRRRMGIGSPSVRRSAAIELKSRGGGLISTALLAGTYVPEHSTELRYSVGMSGALLLRPDHECAALLGGQLARGLPDEFAKPTIEGLAQFGLGEMHPGELRVIGAAYDEVESSPRVFQRAAGLLKLILMQSELPADRVEGDVAAFLSRLSP